MKSNVSYFSLQKKWFNPSGGKLGALLGFGLSTIYFGLVISISMYEQYINFPDSIMLDSDSNLLLFLVYLAISIIATIIGSFTGWALDNIIETWITSFSSWKATLLGVLFCSIIALPLNLPMGRRIFDPSDDAFWTYTLWITLPSLIYILAGSWIASRFYRIHANT